MAASSALSTVAVQLNEVTRVFGSFAALRGITARIPGGKLTLLLGANGAGKSTLLRMISGLAAPSSGSITVFGERDPRAYTPRVGYMAHASQLYDEMSGMENLEYFGALYGIRSRAVFEHAMAAVGLDPGLPRYLRDYSQGMRQRLALARATLHSPDLLLLDEPFSNADRDSAESMARLLSTKRDSGTTILVVTHQPALLAAVADETIELAEGLIASARESRVQPAGSPA